MNRADIEELHYIAPIANVPSIMKYGILSHNQMQRIVHVSVAMPEIQERRENKQIPGAGFLHDYVNLYFDAHNPMLCKCRAKNEEICVLRIDHRVLDFPGVIITDRNASSNWAHPFPVAEGLEHIDADRVFARYWTHRGDLFEEWRHKSEKCAEVLVPERVAPEFVTGAYVANQTALLRFQQLKVNLTAGMRSGMFF